MQTNYQVFRTRSGLKYSLNENLYSKVINNDKNGSTLDLFETFLLAGDFFAQINRFIATVILFLSGNISIISLLVVNLTVGVVSELLWHHSPLYKLKPLSIFYQFIGQLVFGHFLHLAVIICLAIFVSNNWLFALYSILFGLAISIIESLISGYKNTYKHNVSMAQHAIYSIRHNTTGI